MATTEALNQQDPEIDEDESVSIEYEIQGIQHKFQNRKKYRKRALCLLCTLIIFGGLVSIYFYWSMTRGSCGKGENICGDESIMDTKQYGTCISQVQDPLRWNCDRDTANHICCHNRDYAEYSGYWQKTTFLDDVDRNNITIFYDSVTGKPLFKAPIGRSFSDFEKESKKHGWPSFRDDEVVWDNVRCLDDGETVSLDGTHLGHNLPDTKGNRYCINLVSVAGYPNTNSTAL